MPDREEREQRRVKKMAAKELPYDIDTAKLLDMVPELDRERGLGRVLRELMTASKGNFDHMRGELKRATDYHNEHAEETNFIKDEVIPHEHAGFGTKNQVGMDEYDLTFDDGHWILPTNFGGGIIHDDAVTAYSVPTFVPIFIDKPCTILQFRVEVYVASPEQDLRYFVYAGDGDGNFPDTLLYDGLQSTAIDLSSTGMAPSEELELNVGTGWLWVGICTTLSTGTDAAIASYDQGWNFDPTLEYSPNGFWPFPTRMFDLDTGFTGYPSSLSLFTFDPRNGNDTEAPNPFMQHLVVDNGLSSPFYSSFAPIIEYRVR